MKKRFLILFLALLLSLSISSKAQDTSRRIIGISATIQTAQYGIMIPVWLGKYVSIAPAFDFNWGKTIGTDYAIGLVPKFYFMTNKLVPYISVRAGFASFIPDKENVTEKRTTDWLAGIAFGAEYFFDKTFSIGVELQGNYTKSDKNSMRFGNPGGDNFNFATMVSANVYFLRKRK
jgi:hypothetical protein